MSINSRLIVNIIAAQVYAQNGPETQPTVQLDSPLHTESTVTQAGSHEGLHAGKVTLIGTTYM